ncbi:winged helix-turn-helix transcriptional regulator [Haloarcula amylolytica]|uniref:Transcription initiation factor IIB n=1 Tax=Haloarcula amylolytica JCM 13557 TaxID=1227452 RepID=M0L068_9EURY|nr:winged helix-turn-helix transcriptional regulator [Haloarcula amylolytica]EMA25405.1 transcription initiation factor IIB [Haloarcula amylolytica JCM 13557]
MEQRPESQAPSQTEQSIWSDYHTVKNSTEQQVATALEYIEELSAQLNMSDQICIRTAEIYGQAAIEQTTDGRSTEAIVIAAVIIASREFQKPYAIGRIASVTDTDVRDIRQALSRVKNDLYLYTHCPPRAYLSKLTEPLGVDDSTITIAQTILDDLSNENIGGKHPAAVAGAALYVAADGDITQRDIAKVSGVTTETVRIRVKECRKEHPSESNKQG